jgi:hypothetical protein
VTAITAAMKMRGKRNWNITQFLLERINLGHGRTEKRTEIYQNLPLGTARIKQHAAANP